MKITRRSFHALTTSALALTVLNQVACERKPAGNTPGHVPESSSENASSPAEASSVAREEVLSAGELAREPFLIGALERYRPPGLYAEFRAKGVWLVSDGHKLIALSAVCPHLQCLVKWEARSQQFACPCHASHFSLDGTNLPNMKAKRPLERCKLEMVETADGPQVRVDPRTVFIKNRSTDEFGDPGAFLPLT